MAETTTSGATHWQDRKLEPGCGEPGQSPALYLPTPTGTLGLCLLPFMLGVQGPLGRYPTSSLLAPSRGTQEDDSGQISSQQLFCTLLQARGRAGLGQQC